MNRLNTTGRLLGFLLLPLLLVVAAGAWYLPDPRFWAAGQSSTESYPLPKGTFDRRVRNYLVANPEIIVEAMQNLERKQRVAEQTESQAALAAHRAELLKSPESPVGGNPQGDITMLEFFDYNCSYCRQVAPAMAAAESGRSPIADRLQGVSHSGAEFRVRGKSSARSPQAKPLPAVPQGDDAGIGLR